VTTYAWDSRSVFLLISLDDNALHFEQKSVRLGADLPMDSNPLKLVLRVGFYSVKTGLTMDFITFDVSIYTPALSPVSTQIIDIE
tara:strand:- start:3477 stop:3731 length:255 start_codon:yes stop_codon:yes gene_type:complete